MATPTLETYIYGAAAEKFVQDKRPELAGYVMTQKYFTLADNPILAQAFVDFHNAVMSGSNPLNTSVGRRITTEGTKYQDMLGGMTLKDIADSCLGTGIGSAVRTELIAKDGTVNFGDARKTVLDYNDDVEGAQRKFRRKQNDLDTEYQAALAKAYTDDEVRDVEEDFAGKMRKLQKSIHDKMKDLETSYSIKDAQRRFGSVRAMEDAQFAIIGRDAVLNNAYFPVKIEDLRKTSQN
ncbi:MAG: hypothetical protein PHF67_01275 [Candidatus Nanoarchaeia archaeon]|nr:hypothetical protein [Candidatus Nanoarchaeia archaeon]